VLKLVAILRFIRRSTLLITVGLVGGTVTTAGVVMLVTPGPGLVVIIAGLAILATQFAWAERALDKVKQRAIAARDKASARRAARREAGTAAAAAAGSAAADSRDEIPPTDGWTGHWTEPARPEPAAVDPEREAAGSDGQATH